MSFLFPSQDIKQNVIKFLFRQLMTSYTLRFIFDYSQAIVEKWRKRGEDGNTKM